MLNNGLSLKSLASDLLNVTLDKSYELRCSDWEADVLTQEQVRFIPMISYFFADFKKYLNFVCRVDV